MEIEAAFTALGAPVASLWVLKKLCGPTLDVAGEILADRARLWRLKNLAAILGEAGGLVAQNGLDLKQLPLKTLLPLLDGASLEEEPALRTLWARLLANASAEGTTISVTGIACEMLRSLSSADAMVLDAIYQKATAADQTDAAVQWTRERVLYHENQPEGVNPYRLVSLAHLLLCTGLSRDDFEACFDNITRFNVIEAPQYHDLDGRPLPRDHYAFTRLGWKIMNLLTQNPPANVAQNGMSG
jgi:hypothetical protein